MSCRREDGGYAWAEQLAARLQAELGRDHVFFDLSRIGLRTASRIVLASEVLANCTHVIAVIGPHWLSGEDYNLHNPRDPVRVELETALKRPDLRIVPLLVDGAHLPAASQLPQPLRSLASLPPIAIGSGGLDAAWREVMASLRGETVPAPAFNWRIAAAILALIVLSAIVFLIARGG